MGSKTSTQTTNSNQSYTPAALGQLTDIYNRAQSVASQPYQPYSGQLVAGLDPTQTAGIQNINSSYGAFQPYIQQATNYATAGANPIAANDISRYLNPYQNDVINSTIDNINRTNAQQQQQVVGNAAIQGALGGDRVKVAQAELARNQNATNNATLAALNAQNYTQALNAAQADRAAAAQGAGNFANLGATDQGLALQGANAQLGAGSVAQQNTQAGLSANYQQYLQSLAFPYQQAQFLAQIGLPAAVAMGGSGTSSGTATVENGNLGSSIFGGLLTLGGMFSDRRVKEDIEKIGKTNDGQPIYKFRYKGSPFSQLGLMAQDVEKRDPGAVGEVNGIKTVDYDRATEGAVRRAAGGPVGFDEVVTYIPHGGNISGGAAPQLPGAPQFGGMSGSGSGAFNPQQYLKAGQGLGNAFGKVGDWFGGGGDGLSALSGGFMGGEFSHGGIVAAANAMRSGMKKPRHYDDGGFVFPDFTPPSDGIFSAERFQQMMPEFGSPSIAPEAAPPASLPEISVTPDDTPVISPADVGGGSSRQPVASTTVSPFPSVASPGRTAPRGIRNNNPGNIEDGPFARRLPGYTGSDGRFATFDTPQAGLGAMDSLLRSYGNRGLTTPAQIINRWAPAADNNNTSAYAGFVARRLGIDPNTPIDMADPAQRQAVALAMAEFENGAPISAFGGTGTGAGSPVMAFAPDSGAGDRVTANPIPAAMRGIPQAPALPATAKSDNGTPFDIGRILFGKPLSDEARQGLIAAGLGIMASKSPHFGQAIGEGGLQGIQAYAQAKLRGQQQMRVDLEAKRLAQQAEQFAKQFGLSEREFGLKEKTAATSTMQPVKIGQDMFGREIYGVRDPKSGAIRPIDPNTGRILEPGQTVPFGSESNTSGVSGAPGATASAPVVPPDAARVEPPKGEATFGAIDHPVNEDALKGLPEGYANTVKLVAQGRLAPPTSFAAAKPYWQNILRLAAQYDPQFDAVNFNSRQAALKDATSGKLAQNITSFNTVIGHLDTLDKAVEKLNNGRFKLVNSAGNAIGAQINPKTAAALKEFNVAKQAVADELTRAFRGSGGNVHDIKGWEASIDAADSPQALHAAIRQATELLGSRIEAATDQYRRAFGSTRQPIDFLAPKSKAAFERLGRERESVGTSIADTERAAADKAKPAMVRQNGHVYTRQPDGSYKATQ